MLLQELSKIAHYGAQKPLAMWMPEYERIRSIFVLQAGAISAELHNTQTHQLWEQFLQQMQLPTPQESQVAQALQQIVDILNATPAHETQPPTLLTFTHDTWQFATLARKTAVFAEKRDALKKTLTVDQQQANDLRLFQGEGMWYCLEYYLEFYKRLKEATAFEEKRMLIEPKEVTLGVMKLPGLWQDFFDYEELDKFIYLILNDALRTELTAAYFDTRNTLMAMRVSTQPDALFCYNEVTVGELVQSLKRLIVVMFDAFQTVGVHQLTSRAFTPYGFQPMIADIKL